MKLGRKLAAAGLALALTLALAACGGGYTAADATALVKANLDILYLGQYDADYLSTTETSENDAEELYQNNLEGETGRMIGYYGMSPMRCTRSWWTCRRRSTPTLSMRCSPPPSRPTVLTP